MLTFQPNQAIKQHIHKDERENHPPDSITHIRGRTKNEIGKRYLGFLRYYRHK